MEPLMLIVNLWIILCMILLAVLMYKSPYIAKKTQKAFMIYIIGTYIRIVFDLTEFLQIILLIYIFSNLDIDWKKTIKYSRYRHLEKKYENKPLYKIPYKHRILSICRKKVKEDGMALEFVPDEYKDISICRVAVERNRDAIKFVPKELIEKIDW